ncbi:stearoyl-CoA desaturase (delta-9 desaturase) [Vibrio xiamenensis]|uniref:Stearoyl-CoA desaturase (Delta-9 desaturase) n=1 Tax=Vibrio xiamenensis TaxID=861298 RepID=A0A1G8CPG1_9VIBR|nr:stearoyl-CoA desaturase (delta-9 desaturase) [Vibrio xiamenensis]
MIWQNVILFFTLFAVSVFVIPWYAYQHGFTLAHWLWFLIAFSFCNLSITAGYHRLWSHKSYQAHKVLRVIFAIGGAFALQNSALHWSSDHRIHHKHVDHDDKDPYSASRGFWFSHIGWMLRNYSTKRYDDYSNCRDLQKDAIVMWQHRYYLPLVLATNIGIPLILGVIYQDVVGMLLIVGVLRLFLSHHSTFFINSLAHIWGTQPYTTKNSARDNGVLAVFTFGEGYHNFHHIFENDYRNGVRWWQYDPTKWLIKTCAWLGLADKLRSVSDLRIELARAKTKLAIAQQRLETAPNGVESKARLTAEFERLAQTLNDYYHTKTQLLETKYDTMMKQYEHSLIKLKLAQLKLELKQRRRHWHLLTKQYA